MSKSAPVSFAQQRLWFLEQLEPGSHTYNTARAVRLHGRLDVTALRQCLAAIVARHETLRTSFRAVNGVPAQVVAPTTSLPLAIADLTPFGEAERPAQAQHLAEAEIRCPFDLTIAPLIRARLLRLGPEEHILIITLHHIVSDEWSMNVLFGELATLYQAQLGGTSPALPALPIQYADYSVWQREWLQGGRLERELSYWRGRLQGAPPVLELPTDRPHPAIQSFHGAKRSHSFPADLSQQLQLLSRRERCTLFMTTLAAFQVLLARYTGQDDIVVGSPIAGRTRTETEGLIGFFVNTLALRTDLSGNPTFRQLLSRVREVALGAYEHQDLPFERLVEELQPERRLSHSALFQVMFTLQNAAAPKPLFASIAAEPLTVERGVSRFELSLFLRNEPEGLRALLEYNTDLFDAQRIDRLLRHFQVLLEGIVANPDQRISDLPLLTAQEQHQLLREWNQSEVDRPRETTVHGMFEAQVARSPDATAVLHDEGGWTYRELDHRANQVAQLLRARGIGPEVPVGLCLERGPMLLAALLGTLKAGAAYLPLDPTYPPERLALMLTDAQVPIVLTERQLLHSLPTGIATPICLDADAVRPGAIGEAPAECVLSSDQLAYVIYTSGTTGRPKGVQIRHRAVVNLLASLARAPGMGPQDTMLAVSTLTFDVATFELLLPLVTGASVWIASREAARDGRLLIQTLVRSGATVMHATPTTWRLLIDAGWSATPALRVLSGGEALPRSIAEELLARSEEVWDLYGPTETTILSAGSRVRPGIPLGLRNIIDNTTLYLLDRDLMPVPVGVPGELYIGGMGLARGYLGRAALTAERFLPNPFHETPGERMYRTGDLMRYREDGNLEFLGRSDHQVKLRGFRIELGEIEAVLARHPAVRQVAVLAREDTPGNKYLVAYVAPDGSSSPAIADLRDYLRQSLPEYMVPSAFVTLHEFPRNSNGKFDRSALPPPNQQRSESLPRYMAPRSALESILVEIWAEVLGSDQVGTHDDFFELGGHSLLATQVIARIATALGVELPVRLVFEAPTIAGLAQRIVAMEQMGELVG
jgi:amino acid adenylation domain-containing protein